MSLPHADGPGLRPAWGKRERGSPPAETDPPASREHPLAHHLMDVAAVLLELLRCPVIRDRLDTAAGARLSEVDCARLAALAFLHDVGKLHPGFQAKGWPDLWPGRLRGHTSESWSFLVLACRHPDHPFHEAAGDLLGWGDAAEPLIGGMFAHHGRPVDGPADPVLRDWDRPAVDHYRWRDEAAQLARLWREWFPLAFDRVADPLPSTPQFHHLVAGLAALADWIGSDTRIFEYEAPLRRDYDKTAHRRAKEALAAVGLSALQQNVPSVEFRELTGFESPRPAQRVVDQIDASARLVILEAETGSGKTEAALWRFTRLWAAGKVDSLYFALPTRSAATQLHGRVQDTLCQAYGADAPEVVLAIPGTLKVGDHEGTRLPHWKVRWGDDDVTSAHRWAAEHATRFLAARVAVGTVDQAMLAGLPVKHAHLRGSALTRSLLVIDELHASDAYMTEILARLLRDHLAVGGYAMLMSATLGARSRARWLDTPLPDHGAAAATPYPAVWVAGEGAPRVPARSSGRVKDVYAKAISTMAPERAGQLAIEAAREGARVLVIRNTVSAAVETWEVAKASAPELLMAVGDEPALHHGRFAAEDRRLLDHAVETVLSPDRAMSDPGCIVIGTQTLEQSLDIDADLLVTDLCPMDVLLQRIGRLHRHPVKRPAGFERARVLVMVREGGLDPGAQDGFRTGLGAWRSNGEWHWIYGDLAGLELTRRQLDRCPWTIPDMNRALVEGATHPDRIGSLLEEMGDAWKGYESDVGGAQAARRQVGHDLALNRDADYLDLSFPSSDERVMTRLGEDGVVLDFEPLTGPFGEPVSRIALPAHWSRGLGGEREVDVRRDGDSVALCVDGQRFRYSRAGLDRDLGD